MNAQLAPVADAQPAVDNQHPWLGLASFTEESRGYFHGREEEVGELGRRVQRKLLTILFGQSGLGKTSILRAGIVPRLRPEGYCPVYVRIDYSPESPAPTEQIKQAIFRATESTGQWTKAGAAVEGESLWEFLHHRDDILRDASGKTVIPLLIFDQFEEIFTLAQADDAGRGRAAAFIEDLADLVENRPPKALEAKLESDDTITDRFDFGRADYRILIALREDYLAHLESLKGVMPSITQNRMRLARMNGQQALAAVMKPGGALVSQEVAESIVRFIAGGSELRNAEVEPSLLSLICRELNNTRIAQGRSEISADLLAGSHDTILAEFYERALADQPAAVRKVIEDQLLTESGYRESLAEERLLKAFAAAGAAPDALATLVNRRLLRIEERLDVRRVELTHDVLCGVVKASRELRLEREALDEAERQLEAQRAREAATRKALVRARQIAAVCAVLALGAIVSAIFGYLNMNRAREAEARALQTRQMAESARGEAEKLIVYLLDDFYRELEPIGRLDIVGDLSKRALDYYSGLPPELRTKDTDRNRALALVRHGAVARYQARLDEGEKSLTEAIRILGGLREGGDKSEITAIGYALGLSAQARISGDRSKFAEAGTLAQQSVDVLDPLMKAPSPSVALRRAYGNAANFLGFGQLRTNHSDLAVKTLESVREALRSIDDLQLGDLAAAAAYAEATSWQMAALEDQGRLADARSRGEEAIRVAGQVLEKRPGHMAALRSRALTTSSLAEIEAASLNLRKSASISASSASDWEDYLRLDPGNAIGWNNLLASQMRTARSLQNLGRTSEALARYRAVLVIEKRGKLQSNTYGGLMNAAGAIAEIEAESGRLRDAQASLSDMRRFAKVATQKLAPGSWNRVGYEEFATGLEATVDEATGDYAAAREKVLASIKRLQQLKPSSDLERRQEAEGYASFLSALASLSYRLKDYAAAEENARASVEYRKRLPLRSPRDEAFATEAKSLLALSLARQGRLVDARQVIEPVLKLHRELRAKGSDHLFQYRLMAEAQLAGALAWPAETQVRLAEAAATLDAFPEEMKRLRSIATLREEIAQEQKRR
jgi:hypothetical protein